MLPDESTKAASDLTVEALVDIWDRLSKKLVNAGVPPERVANSLWVAGALYASDPANKLGGAIDCRSSSSHSHVTGKLHNRAETSHVSIRRGEQSGSLSLAFSLTRAALWRLAY